MSLAERIKKQAAAETAVVFATISKDLKDETAALLKQYGLTWNDFVRMSCEQILTELKGNENETE